MKRRKKGIAALLLALCVTLGLLPALTPAASAATLDENSATWSENSTITDDVTISGGVTVSADITLTIPEGKTLTVNDGINAEGYTLTVEGKGTLTVTGSNGNYGGSSSIGGTGGNGITGNIIVNGATVNVTGGAGGDGGVGGNGGYGVNGSVTVNSGSVTVTGGKGDNSKTGGAGGDGVNNSVTVNGGTANVYGGRGGHSFGGDGGRGGYGVNGSVTVKGGTANVNGGYGGGSNGDTGAAVKDFITFASGGRAEESDNGNSWTAISGSSSTKRSVYVTLSYTVTAADTVTGTDKKYHYNEDITIAVTVSGADFEGGEFTLNYDSDTLEVTTFPTNNVIADNAQTAGTVKFEAQTKTKITDGQALATIAFKVKTKVTTETTCNFTFEGTPKICYDTGENSVAAATVTPGSVIVEPVTYEVALMGNDGVTFVKSGATVTTDTAIDGQDYSVTIGEYSATDYEYAVTLAVEGTDGTTTLTPDTDGKLTIAGANITGDFTLTVTKTLANFEVNVYENYVTGWTLVTIAKASGRTDEPVYDYNGSATYYVNAYNAYAYLVKGAVTAEDAKAKVSLGTSAAGTIATSEQYDVNNTGKVDYSDVLLTYRCYVLAHPEQDTEKGPATAMETYLRADVNGDKKVDTTDVSAVDGNRTQETT